MGHHAESSPCSLRDVETAGRRVEELEILHRQQSEQNARFGERDILAGRLLRPLHPRPGTLSASRALHRKQSGEGQDSARAGAVAVEQCSLSGRLWVGRATENSEVTRRGEWSCLNATRKSERGQPCPRVESEGGVRAVMPRAKTSVSGSKPSRHGA